MQADLICIGNELLTGLVENSNTGFLAKRLWSAGIALRESTVVTDDVETIRVALNRGLETSDLVITTGGLGPTDDDLTREAVAEILNLPLVINDDWLNKMQTMFSDRGYTMPENNRKQAALIQGAQLLENKKGTAPGMIIEWKGKLIILLPGPPYEMQNIFDDSVIPFLKRYNSGKMMTVRTLKCIGLGESMLEERIKAIGNQLISSLSYVARGYEVDLQIKGTGDPGTVSKTVEETENMLRAELGDSIFGSDDETLAGRVCELMIAQGLTLGLAESCSGGLLSDSITDIPGASKFYRGGVTAYSGQAKNQILGIEADLIEKEGEVSEAIALAMAERARVVFEADIGVGITGIAGPDSDSSNRPVGLVYIAISNAEGGVFKKLEIGGGRRGIKERTVQFALDMIRRELLRRKNLSNPGRKS